MQILKFIPSSQELNIGKEGVVFSKSCEDLIHILEALPLPFPSPKCLPVGKREEGGLREQMLGWL